jgi:dUTP pyrophosphatase
MKYVKLTSTAKTPTKAHPTDAGFDLYADGHNLIAPGCRAKIPTGIALEIPDGLVGLVWPRSKLANTYGLDILAGVVDAPYRGEIMISVINHGDKPFEVFTGDKIAQLIIQPVELVTLEEVRTLSDSDRGASGINDSELRIR